MCGGRRLGWPSDDWSRRTSSGNFAASTAMRSQQAAASPCGHGSAAAGRQRSSAGDTNVSDPATLQVTCCRRTSTSAPRSPQPTAACGSSSGSGSRARRLCNPSSACRRHCHSQPWPWFSVTLGGLPAPTLLALPSASSQAREAAAECGHWLSGRGAEGWSGIPGA